MVDLKHTLNIWVLTEGIAGTENQCLGVAESLGGVIGENVTVLRTELKQPWRMLSPYIGGGAPGVYTENSDIPKAPWPDIVIASGRKSIASALYIKRQSAGKSLIVQLQDPRWAADKFDLVAVPFHDSYRRTNALITHGAPNRVNNNKLNAEKSTWNPPASWADKRKKVALLIGGKSRAYDFTPETIARITFMALNLAQKNYDVMVTASRRTGVTNYNFISKVLSQHEHIYFWDGEGENPYFSFLAHADHIIVTPDSASMLSEAASTGKPTYRLELPGGNAKFNRFHQHMEDIGACKAMQVENPELDFKPKIVLNDAALVAEKISALIAQKRA
jgi:mitochondrial fission protein ELM1